MSQMRPHPEFKYRGELSFLSSKDMLLLTTAHPEAPFAVFYRGLVAEVYQTKVNKKWRKSSAVSPGRSSLGSATRPSPGISAMPVHPPK